MNFDIWFEQLQRLAKQTKCEWLIGDKESHRDGFEDGLTPLEELCEQEAESQASQ